MQHWRMCSCPSCRGDLWRADYGDDWECLMCGRAFTPELLLRVANAALVAFIRSHHIAPYHRAAPNVRIK